MDLARLSYGHNVAVGEEKEARYVAALKAFVDQWADHELAATALHRWAAVLQSKGDLVQAHALARRGAETYPESVGGIACRNLIEQIQARSFVHPNRAGLEPPFPTIAVRYRNLTNVWFRVVPVDWSDFLDRRRNRPERLNERERKEFLERKAAVEWSVALPATADFKERLEQVPVPEDLPAGYYFLIASHRPDFGEADNLVTLTDFWVSTLALIVRPAEGAIEGFVLEAASGEPVRGAEVAAWFLDRQAQSRARRTDWSRMTRVGFASAPGEGPVTSSGFGIRDRSWLRARTLMLLSAGGWSERSRVCCSWTGACIGRGRRFSTRASRSS